jgi:phosphatidate cytidylyltransferase
VESNLRSRLLTAIVGIPLLILLVGWGPTWVFMSVLVVLIIEALREYFSMVFPGRIREQLCGILFGLSLCAVLLMGEGSERQTGLSLLLVVCFSVYLFMAGGLQERLNRLAWTLFGGVYLGYLLPHWMLLFHMPNGRAWVFFVLLVIMLGDTMAYLVGIRFGTKKLAPEISPGKTVEGSLGYIAGSVAGGYLGAQFLITERAMLEVLILSLVLSMLGQIGDLFESLIKRVFTVKDSGTILPGHGGLLDRLDSLIFPAVFTTTYLKAFHP